MKKEPINFMFRIVGKPLLVTNPDTLITSEILAIPEFELFHIESHNQGNIIEEIYYNFLITSADVKTYSIDSGFTISFSDEIYNYSFTVTDHPLPDMTGISKIKCNFTGKEYV